MVPDPSQRRRRLTLNELSRAYPGDRTLQNLLSVLASKLDSCSRLPVFEYEAAREGFDECVEAFEVLARVERRSVEDLLAVLRTHLDARDDRVTAEGRQP